MQESARIPLLTDLLKTFHLSAIKGHVETGLVLRDGS